MWTFILRIHCVTLACCLGEDVRSCTSSPWHSTLHQLEVPRLFFLFFNAGTVFIRMSLLLPRSFRLLAQPLFIAMDGLNMLFSRAEGCFSSGGSLTSSVLDDSCQTPTSGSLSEYWQTTMYWLSYATLSVQLPTQYWCSYPRRTN